MEGRIYIHKNKINGKCYVGQTIQDPKKRWKRRYGNSTKFAKAIKKYGWSNFDHILLPEIYQDYEDLNKAEILLIEKLDSYKKGYNSTLGGSSAIYVVKKTEKTDVEIQEIKDKISMANRNRMVSQEVRDIISRKLTGRKLSEETKEKMRKPKSEQAKENMRKPKSEEAKYNMRMAQIKRHEKNINT